MFSKVALRHDESCLFLHIIDVMTHDSTESAFPQFYFTILLYNPAWHLEWKKFT